MVRPWQGEIEGTLPGRVNVDALRDQVDRQACELSDLRWELAYLRARYSGFRFRAVDGLNDLLRKTPLVHRWLKSGAVAATNALRLFGRDAEEVSHASQSVVFSEGLSAEQSSLVLAAAHSKPLISIIVPVYKVAPQWLQRCLASVIAQHYD